jgi:hypothetical protein
MCKAFLTVIMVLVCTTATRLWAQVQQPFVYDVVVSAVTASTANVSYRFQAGNASTSTEVRCWAFGNTGGYRVVPGPSGTGNTPISGNATITGLLPNTAYQYSVYATNSAGQGWSRYADFTTLAVNGAPIIQSMRVDSITNSNALVSYTINAAGAATSTVIWYRRTTDPVSNSIRINGATATGNTRNSYTTAITGLQPTTSYVATLAITNSYGSNNSITTFTTTPTPILPVISNISTGTIADTWADINFTLHHGYANCTTVIKYGLSPTALNSSISVTPNTAGGLASANYIKGITGLNRSTTYYYRIETTNSAGTTQSTVQNITTSAFAAMQQNLKKVQ